MKGKLLFVAGLATGYVLGTRAGRERYEQIKRGWLAVWNTEPVQTRVATIKKVAAARVGEVPGAIFKGIGKVAGIVTGDGTPGEKLDKTIAETKSAVDDITDAADDTPASGTRSRQASSTSAKKPAK